MICLDLQCKSLLGFKKYAIETVHVSCFTAPTPAAALHEIQPSPTTENVIRHTQKETIVVSMCGCNTQYSGICIVKYFVYILVMCLVSTNGKRAILANLKLTIDSLLECS